ncbi:MAG: hypothetical protein A2Y12_06345 [Planctomycetes bacterium GWF2_42_9]|nr:MAG: hypothetical protein A2Y12_06345 [Planctomycetes bacterium GWF2_42_9]
MRKCTEKVCYECECCVEKPACRWCEYFVPDEPETMLRNELLDGDDSCDGFCQCQPPRMGQMKKDKHGELQQKPAEWPLVHDFYWCGHFKERSDLQNVSDEKIKTAEDFIRSLLQTGPLTNNQVRSKARNAGVRPNALLLASRNLRINYEPTDKFHREWKWQLPEGVINKYSASRCASCE